MAVHPSGGERESTKERIARLVAEGHVPPEAVGEAEQMWEERLRHGVPMPHGEMAEVTINDLYHLLVDPRIWRKPIRIELLLRGVFEVRTAKVGRRRALSRWQEGDVQMWGYAILEPSSKVRTIHLTSERSARRMQRQGDLLWPR